VEAPNVRDPDDAAARSALAVERVEFITIPTRDEARSRAWYRETLGLPADPNNPDELVAGQVTLVLWNPERENIDFQPSIGGFAVRVRDVEAAKKELEAKGVEFVGADDTGAVTWPSASTLTATP
jgi:catechol 2,3-dioxygenase-like lactoylglutathione lyase family enzyme